MIDYTGNLKKLTRNELLREYACVCDAMQGMANVMDSDARQLSLSKLIIINNEIREREK